LKPTVLASVSLLLINFTMAVCHAGVDTLVLNSALEEALATFAGDDAVV
jgi:hypothetical protein